jgi:hypothetical protein
MCISQLDVREIYAAGVDASDSGSNLRHRFEGAFLALMSLEIA